MIEVQFYVVSNMLQSSSSEPRSTTIAAASEENVDIKTKGSAPSMLSTFGRNVTQIKKSVETKAPRPPIKNIVASPVGVPGSLAQNLEALKVCDLLNSPRISNCTQGSNILILC